MTRFKIALLSLLALLMFVPLASIAKDPIRVEEGIVKKVADGGTKLKVRLWGIDAPETAKVNRRTGVVSKPGQPFGEEAYRGLERKVLGKRVRVIGVMATTNRSW